MAGVTDDGHEGVALVWDGGLDYDFGPTHPLKPIRVELTVELIHALDLITGDGVVEVGSGEFTGEELARIHTADYIEAVTRIGADPSAPPAPRFGLGPGDNPTFYGMHEASRQVCAASKEAARVVMAGEAAHAFNPAGGLHHAMPDRASGFCVYNDPAAAIHELLDAGADRVAYVDVDTHHGDGVEHIFWDDERVLTISLHESGRYLFPGTGEPDDIGGEDAPGSAANVVFAPGTTGEVWLAAFDATVESLVAAFDPDVLVTQLGCDTHARDPLAHLALTTDDYRVIAGRLHRLAHETAGGRWVATGGGGYQVVQVVPRAWTIYFAEMAGTELPDETPASWRQVVEERTDQRPPRSFEDGVASVGDETLERARNFADNSVARLRELVFPNHGL